MPVAAQPPESPTLDIAEDKLAFIIERAREFDVKESDGDPNSGSNANDDGNADVLEDKPGDATREELTGAIRELNEDERAELVALAWLGRGTYDIEEWDEAVSTAKSEHGKRAAEYLIGLPLLGDYLEDGMAAFDEGIVDRGRRAAGKHAGSQAGSRTLIRPRLAGRRAQHRRYAAARRCYAPSDAPAMDFWSFSKARTSIWRTRSLETPYFWDNSSSVAGSSCKRRA